MKALTDLALLLCDHVTGTVRLAASQHFVTVQKRAMLVAPDPVGKPVVGCSNMGPTIKPCTATLPVQAGYSTLARINGRAVCLDTVSGITDGTPPGVVSYTVKNPGQTLVNFSL